MSKIPLHELAANSVALNTQMVRTDDLVEDFVESANDGDDLARRWLDRLVRYGVSDAFKAEVLEHARTVRFETYPELDKETGRFYWRRDLVPNQQVSREGAYALILVLLINSDRTDYIGRCSLKDCRKFFYGDTRTRWCSTTCGSRYRVTKKRNPAKARYMI